MPLPVSRSAAGPQGMLNRVACYQESPVIGPMTKRGVKHGTLCADQGGPLNAAQPKFIVAQRT